MWTGKNVLIINEYILNGN